MSKQYWDSQTVLKVYPDQPGFTCVGIAVSKGRRCCNTINQNDRSRAKSLLHNLAAVPLNSSHRILLERLACVTLCSEWHRQAREPGDTKRPRKPQVAEMVTVWSKRIQLEIERRVQENVGVVKASRSQQTETSRVLVSVSSSSRAAPISRSLKPSMSGAVTHPDLHFPPAPTHDPFIDSSVEVSNTNANPSGSIGATPTMEAGWMRTQNVRNSSVAILASKAGQSISTTGSAHSSAAENIRQAELRTSNEPGSSSVSTSTMTAGSTDSKTASESFPASDANGYRSSSASTSTSSAEQTSSRTTPESPLASQSRRDIISARSNDNSEDRTRRPIKPIQPSPQTAVSENDTPAENDRGTRLETDIWKQTIKAVVESPTSTTFKQALTPIHKISTRTNLQTPPTTGTPARKQTSNASRHSASIAVLAQAYTFSFTPPDSNEQSLNPFKPEQETPLAYKEKRKPVGSAPRTPIFHGRNSNPITPPSSSQRLLTTPNSSQITPLPNSDVTPASTTLLVESYSPFPDSRYNAKKVVTRVCVHEMSSGVLTEESVVYCRGKCRRAAHRCWGEIWRSSNSSTFWQKVKCSFWYLVRGRRRVNSGVGARLKELEGDGVV